MVFKICLSPLSSVYFGFLMFCFCKFGFDFGSSLQSTKENEIDEMEAWLGSSVSSQDSNNNSIIQTLSPFKHLTQFFSFIITYACLDIDSLSMTYD